MKQSVLTTLDISGTNETLLRDLQEVVKCRHMQGYFPRVSEHQAGYTIFLGGNGKCDIEYLENTLVNISKIEENTHTFSHQLKQLLVQAIVDGHAFINIDNG